ncbi:MAG TPA: ATP-binding cassette domain-containing protein, partial [Vicinamibacteria bacterium]|nr:ATP-binding cassette domain-containing protein [Vicinamibacteria bacterium]
MSDSPLLQIADLSVRRGSRDVVRRVSLAVDASERVALVGPNAAGKSTLLSAIAGLLKPSSGEI